MSIAQQLGLIGNSVKVQSLPTASAETFGAGNRFYTLIGQQEGYITGHTYRTVVANDVYSWEDVAYGNYNMLDNIPVINQDLSASGFTPVANTYYRHTGATTNTFTQGVIYLYDTAYHKLGESGGTTLNRYELSLTVSELNSRTYLLYKIYTQSKGRVTACQYSYDSSNSYNYKEFTLSEIFYSKAAETFARVKFSYVEGQNPGVMIRGYTASRKGNSDDYVIISSDKTINAAGHLTWPGTTIIKIVYFNDVEIT